MKGKFARDVEPVWNPCGPRVKLVWNPFWNPRAPIQGVTRGVPEGWAGHFPVGPVRRIVGPSVRFHSLSSLGNTVIDSPQSTPAHTIACAKILSDGPKQCEHECKHSATDSRVTKLLHNNSTLPPKMPQIDPPQNE